MLGLFRLNLAQKPCFAMLFKLKKMTVFILKLF